MPRNRKTDSPKGRGRSLPELSHAVDDLETTQETQGNDIATMKWLVGISLAIFVLLSTAVIQLSIHTIRENAASRAEYTEVINDLRQENIEIRADHNELRLEFELYKAQNPK